MISSRGKLARQCLVLVAREAARRFAPDHSSHKDIRAQWRPVVLRWRLALKRSMRATKERAARLNQIIWRSELVFRFATYCGDRILAKRATAQLPGASSHFAAVLPNRRFAGARTVVRPVQMQRYYFRKLATESRVGWRPGLHRGAVSTSGAAPTRVERPVVLWSARRAGAPVAGHSLESPRKQIRREQATQRSSESRPARQHWWQQVQMRAAPRVDFAAGRGTMRKGFPVLFYHAQELALRAGRRLPLVTADQEGQPQRTDSVRRMNSRHNGPRVRIPFGHAEELVWRRARPSPSAVIENKPQQEHSAFVHRPPARSLISQETAADAAAAAKRSRTVEPAKLDPGLLDRLTDDVIRRVEQRLRIERQRRGL